jgi:hypothetical protein
MIWTTIDGRSWSLTIGDKMASVWLIDEEFYGARVWQINNIPIHLGEFECIKNAKRACVEEIERQTLWDHDALEDMHIWASVIDEATVKEILQEERSWRSFNFGILRDFYRSK